jgi:O-antigen/teichoic acid export membrane protein
MGVVRKQGVANSLWLYLGMGLGYVNMGVIMAKLLSTENLGLRQVVFQAGDFFSVIALVGLNNVVNRYFPAYMHQGKSRGGMMGFVFLYWLVGVAFTALLMLVFKPAIMGFYESKSQLLTEFYLYIIPFGASLALYEGLSAYCRALLKTTFPLFVREVAQRVVTTVMLVMVYMKWIGFDDFMTLYLLSYVVATVVLVAYLVRLGEFRLWVPGEGFAWTAQWREMLVFGMYSWFNNAMQIITKTVDVLMLGAYDLKKAGIYGLGSLIGNFVQVPSQSLRQIAAPLISRYFEENNLKAIGDLYRRSCMVQLVSGLFLYLAIVVNLDVLFTLWRSEFEAARTVIVYLGASRLIAGSTGLNGRIIVESRYFRVNFYANLLLGGLAALLNWLLIPRYGIPGAAVASSLAILLVSAFKVVFVYARFGLQPFETRTAWALGVGGLAYAAAAFLPLSGLFVVDLAVRTGVFALVFVPLALRLRLSDNLNQMVEGWVGKWLRR